MSGPARRSGRPWSGSAGRPCRRRRRPARRSAPCVASVPCADSTSRAAASTSCWLRSGIAPCGPRRVTDLRRWLLIPVCRRRRCRRPRARARRARARRRARSRGPGVDGMNDRRGGRGDERDRRAWRTRGCSRSPSAGRPGRAATVTMLAISAAPIEPPMVRMLAFMPLATPVCSAGTAPRSGSTSPRRPARSRRPSSRWRGRSPSSRSWAKASIAIDTAPIRQPAMTTRLAAERAGRAGRRTGRRGTS